MTTPFDNWLDHLRNSNKGPVALYAHRNCSFETDITINMELPSSTLRGQVRAYPDATVNLASFTVDGPDSGSPGMTKFTISLDAETVKGLPSDTDLNGEEPLAFDLLITPDEGFSEQLLFGGVFYVLGGVTS